MRARVGESVPLASPFGAVFVAWDDDTIVDWLKRAGDALSEDERELALAALERVRRRGYVISTDIVRPDLASLLVELADGSPDLSKLETRDALIRDLARVDTFRSTLRWTDHQRVAQITAPVFDAAGTVVYSLMILGPGYDLQPDEVAAYGSHLLTAAAEATTRLGGRVGRP